MRDGFVNPRGIFAVDQPKSMRPTDDCSVFLRGEIEQSVN